LYYTADALGADGNGVDSTPMMVDWVGASIPLQDGESISTVCDGEVTSSTDGKTYCADTVMPKSFTEAY